MTLGKKTRVLIVDDSAFMRKVLQGIIRLIRSLRSVARHAMAETR